MAENDSARVLLEAATAIRLASVDRDALIQALEAWRVDPNRRFMDLLVERGVLDPSKRKMIEEGVARAVANSRGDFESALAAAGPVVSQLSRHLASPSRLNRTFGSEAAREEDGASDDSSWCLELGHSDSGARHGRVSPAEARTEVDSRARSWNDQELPTQGLPGNSSDADVTMDLPSNPMATGPVTEVSAGNRDQDSETLDLSEPASREAKVEVRPGPGTSESRRFRILRPHARGGLGQVYVARDEELNREVALKEILGGQADREESRTRFLIEAEVTGGLEHPGIVPVYGLGRYPDGRPYYAMRFIRGQSMKEAIDQHHDPEAAGHRSIVERELGFRKLLNQLIDVCNAMSYAHSRGVLHRDLKPGNVMLGAFGETLVVDWGLAKFQDEETEGAVSSADSADRLRPMSAHGTSKTLYGSTIGTPQFMSPEQALGKLDELGPPSDVYSIGAILYVILTGQVAFGDRQLYTVLDKVRRGDFPPPRAVRKNVDPTLNAICLKAMALHSADRYHTAKALANDLEHWLADEPVSVYRESLPRRAWRWAKRHRTVVASLAALLITATASLGVYSVLIKREQQRTNRYYVLAHGAIDRMLSEFAEEDLADIPQMEPVRKRMLVEAREFYEALQRGIEGNPRNPGDLAMADLRLGDIQSLLGEDKGAEARYDKAIEALKSLRARDPLYRSVLGRSYHARGVLLRHDGRASAAEADLKNALEVREALCAEAPDNIDYRRDRVKSLYQLAALQASLDRDADARQSYEEVIRLQTAITKDARSTDEDRRLLGRYLNNQANLLKKVSTSGTEPETLYRRALAIQEEVVGKSPAPVAVYAHELAKTHANLHNLLADKGAFDEAEVHAIKGLTLGKKLADDFRRTPEFQFQFASATLDRGEILRRRRRLDDSRASLDEAVERAEPLVKAHPDRRRYRSTLALALLDRGVLSYDEGRDDDAEIDLTRSAEILAPLADAGEPLPEDLRDLGRVHQNLGRVKAHQGRPEPAEAEFLKAVERFRPLAEAKAPRVDDLQALGDVYHDLARARFGQKRDEEGDRALDEAIRFHQRAAAEDTAPGDIPPLWRDLRLQVDRLRVQKRYVELAEVATQLPGLRPNHVDSLVIAARTLAACAFPAVHSGFPDAMARARARTFADRAVAVLRKGVDAGLFDAEMLETELKANFYAPIRDLEAVRELLQRSRESPATKPG